MRVLYTIASLDPRHGGPSRSLPRLATAVSALGSGAAILTLREGARAEARVGGLGEGVALETISCRTSRYLPTLWTRRFGEALRRRLEGTPDTIVHDTGVWLPTNHLAARAARAAGRPLVVSPRGTLTRWAVGFRGLRKKIAWRAFQRRALLSARVLHATSADEARDLRALGLPQPIAVIPNGVELPSPRARRPEGRPRRILFLSRMHPKKGLFNLVDAVARLAPVGWELIVAGPDEGGHGEEVSRRVRQLGVQPLIRFQGAVEGEPKWDLYASADLFVLPSHSENFGLVIAEALASGVPVITTRGTPWQDLITHGCGWWIDVGVEPLVVALRQALALTDVDRRAMGDRGRGLIESRYSWSQVGRDMHAVYRWILGQDGEPGCVL